MKTAVESTFLPFALPDLDDEELREVADVLRSHWLTTGPKTRQFESEFAAYVGARHAVAVNSCTAAMHLALEALGVGRGDEVITTPYTFAATAEVIRYFDAVPVFVDVDRSTLNIDASKIEGAITPRTKAIIPVHYAGRSADLDRIGSVASRHGISVVEDAAHALPTRYRGRMIGTISTVTCFSFYATKTLTTGEGGMICTDDDAIADRCRIMSLHGISRDAWKRYTAEGSWSYDVIAPGFKYNMTDLAAAVGIAQLKKVERMWRRRSEIATRFTAAFSKVPELEPPAAPADGEQHSWHLYPLRLRLETLKIDRAAFIELLRKRQIGSSVHFIPLHVQPYYRDLYGYASTDFPVAFEEFGREVSLPIYSLMSEDDVERVIEAVRDIVLENRR